MSDPTRFSDEERAREALRDQGYDVNRLDPALNEQLRADQYPATAPDQPVVFKERLFSRKALFGWAFAALLFVFIVRMVVPVVFETVRETIVSRMDPPTHNSAGTPVTAPVAPTAVPALPAVPAAPAPATIAAPERPESKGTSSAPGATVPAPAKK